MAKTRIGDLVAAYEQWLRKQLGSELVKADLATKHEQMAAHPFPFLRATYWRWAETILRICPELAEAPPVLAVGDIHLENFGTWRDVEGRLIWGVNDFDEAAEMPYLIDLVRLGASATLGVPHLDTDKHICAHILDGYRAGLADPQPIVLDQDDAWMRKLFVVREDERQHFWDKMQALSAGKARPPKKYIKALRAAFPDPKIDITVKPRSAGLGSLGRPRYVGMGDWNGGHVVREVKAMMPSAWTLSNGRSSKAIRCYEIATGRHRAPDPWYDLRKGISVRRLSPNNRKLDTAKEAAALASPKMLQAMARDLAAIHLGSANHRAAIEKDLRKRMHGWLYAAVERAADAVRADQAKWKHSYNKSSKKHAGRPGRKKK